ncbi:MAG: hypothetical protein F6K00_15030 [Leptolyngbya sp. SIOISBB]|nr:hypothetical protein [Leptolyngbya sp. SIOISBB]
MSSQVLLDTWLARNSPKQLLQKALLATLKKTLTSLPWSPDFCTLSLSDLQVVAGRHWQYESAIAHPLAAMLGTDATTLAPRLATEMTAGLAHQNPAAIATGLQSEVNSADRLTFILSSEGLQGWLHHWLHSSLPALLTVEEEPQPHSEARSGNWPLCDRLQLSLPMLLQWADTRCQQWQAECSPMGQSSAMARSAVDPLVVDAVWTFLLPAVMHGLDQLAAGPLTSKTGQRVGYRLAVRVYELDAHLADWRSQEMWGQALVARSAALLATQKALQLLLATTFRQAPCKAL